MPKPVKFCCCGGCFEIPADRSLVGAAQSGGQEPEGPVEMQPIQQYCCKCIPKHLCVSYHCEASGEGASVILEPDHSCPPDKERDWKTHYKGILPVSGVAADVRFDFEVEDGKCYISLSSDELGIYGKRVEMDAEKRCLLCATCERCDDVTVSAIEWDITSYDPECSSDGIIGIRPAAHTSIPRAPDCSGCDNPYHNIGPCDNWCCGCHCICTCAEIAVIVNRSLLSQETACLGDSMERYNEWSAGGFTVALVPIGDDDICALDLIETGELQPENPLTPISVGGDPLQPCPTPSGRWEYSTPEGDEVVVLFECESCFSESNKVLVSGCCDDTYPLILVVSIASDDCLCGNGITFPLIYDKVSAIWTGSSEGLDGFCENGIWMELGCSGDDKWELSLIVGDCDHDRVVEMTGTCQPLSLIASVELLGLGCCDADEVTIGGGTIVITITE